MCSVKEQEAINRLMAFLQEWDNGNKTTRSNILNDFIILNQGKTGPELEQEFSQGGSLFLARLTTWLRLSFMFGTCLNELLQAISIFLSAASGSPYLLEFVEVGGILTLLEILGLKEQKEENMREALNLLQILASSGRKFKELICESYGVRGIAETLAMTRSEEVREQAQQLLECLAQGNPKYQNQVYKGLIAVLPCASPKAQQLALQTLQIVQSAVKSSPSSIVEALLGVLQTMHLEVQYEALQLIKALMHHNIRSALLTGLVKLLKPSLKDTEKSRPKILDDPSMSLLLPSLPVFMQQAAAAKAVSMLSQESPDLCEELIRLQVVHHLLYAIGNQEHADSQRQASLALVYLVQTSPIVEEHVRTAIGETLFQLLMTNPETLYMTMDLIQAEILISNKVNIPESLHGKPLGM
ncbi:armadillo-like helical domain containing protein 1 isoform X2 [Rhinatrema bivittatum]|uniref:armadillo-like helical domain containing protein 1 isoform X2 n=1 Tax=Rhinatrema bivittatum TaxID=194408 RepID=UPI00112DC993|nr:armadillo-like helical domain containing protein 1 isoform X2 [Rhinatrema bivittatum]